VVLVAVEEEEQAVRRVRLPRPGRDAHGRWRGLRSAAMAKRDPEIVVTSGALCDRGARRRVEHGGELRTGRTATGKRQGGVLAESSLQKCEFMFLVGRRACRSSHDR
jgi:hypothetical protein